MVFATCAGHQVDISKMSINFDCFKSDTDINNALMQVIRFSPRIRGSMLFVVARYVGGDCR